MKQVADGVWQLPSLIPNSINSYMLEDVLVDAGARQDWRRIRRQLGRRPPAAHALTHAHPDHQGCSKRVCEAFDVPFWVGEGDVAKAERPELIAVEQPDHPIARLFGRLFTGPGHPVDRALREGDDVAGFRVLDSPGHSTGHITLWRASDRVLIAGDVFVNLDVVTLLPGLREPKPFLTADPAENRRSARRLGELEPAVVCFGHGKPLRDTRRFVEFAAALPG